MTVIVKFDPTATSPQAAIIPDATPKNDGVMTAIQADKLGRILPGNAALMNPTGVLTSAASLVANNLARCDTSGGSFVVTLPQAASARGAWVIIKNVSSSSNSITIAAGVGDNIDNSPTLMVHKFALLISDGENQWMVV